METSEAPIMPRDPSGLVDWCDRCCPPICCPRSRASALYRQDVPHAESTPEASSHRCVCVPAEGLEHPPTTFLAAELDESKDVEP